MLPVVTGSQALQHYGLLKNRVPSDWDLIMIAEKSLIKVKGQTIDISDANSQLELTNKIIFDLSQDGDIIQTPVGPARVVPLSLLKVMKISSLPLNKIRNSYDLQSLKEVILTPFESNLAALRSKETLNKIISQRSAFFNKYKVPRFFSHDELHLFVNPNPIYKTALFEDSPVLISESKFADLCNNDKCLIFWEEAFVLSLERFLIPRVRKYPMFVDSFSDTFFRVDKTSDPGIYWLNKLCAIGLIKDHPEWLGQWGIDNYEMIISQYPSWWDQTFDNLDRSFWDRLLKF